MSNIIAIGDIHGHYSQLLELWEKLQKETTIDFEKDEFVWLGDFVDGGPDTKKVLDFLIALKDKPNHHMLYGNHEDLMMDAFNPRHPVYGDYYLWWNQGGEATLNSFKPKQSLVSPTEWERYQRAIMQNEDIIDKKYFDFINGLKMFYETEDYFFVHGGVHPGVSLKEQTENLGDGLQGSNKYDMIWNRDFIGSKYDWGKKIIFGHTTSRDYHPMIYPNMIGIDTMLHNSGKLTALILPDEKIVQTDFTDSY